MPIVRMVFTSLRIEIFGIDYDGKDNLTARRIFAALLQVSLVEHVQRLETCYNRFLATKRSFLTRRNLKNSRNSKNSKNDIKQISNHRELNEFQHVHKFKMQISRILV